MEDRGRKTERTLGWIADKEASEAEIGTVDPSRALVSAKGDVRMPLKNVAGSFNVSFVVKLMFLLPSLF